MAKSKRFISLLVFICSASFADAQVNEFREKLYHSQNQTDQINDLKKLCENYYSLPRDSFQKYINWGLSLCKNDQKNSLYFLNYQSNFLEIQNQYEAAVKLSDSIYDIVKKMPDQVDLQAKCLQNKSGYYVYKHQYEKAIEAGLQNVKIAEKNSDPFLQIEAYITTGFVYMEINKWAEAANWFGKGIQLAMKPELHYEKANLFLNYSSCLNNLGKHSEALKYVNIGLKNARKFNKFTSMANGLNIRADIYLNTNQLELAGKDLEEATEIRKQAADTFYLASDLAQYALFLARVNKTDLGIAKAKEGLQLIKNFKFWEKEKYLYQALAANYEKSGNLQLWAQTQTKIMELTDSIHSAATTEAIVNAQTKYETEKKELIISNQSLNLRLRKFYIIALIAALILAIPILYFGIKKLRNNQKIKLNSEIDKERRRISNDLHDGVGAYASSLFSGIGNLTSQPDNERIVQLKNTALELIEKLNQTVWVLDTEHIAVSDLFDKYKNWFLKIIPNFDGIQYEFEDEIKTNSIIKPQVSLDLLNMMQEMTNNALKHSNCKNIKCVMRNQNEQLQIEFSDDGKGFDLDESKNGNGLNNLRKRSEKLDGNLRIESNETGTRFYFNLSI